MALEVALVSELGFSIEVAGLFGFVNVVVIFHNHGLVFIMILLKSTAVKVGACFPSHTHLHDCLWRASLINFDGCAVNGLFDKFRWVCCEWFI